MSHPYVAGLTGGIGSGKSAVSDLFAQLGITIVDADVVARQVVEPGTPALAKIAGHFGRDILQEDGTLDRAALRKQVFADETAKQWLNALLHPAIREEMRKQLEAATSPYVIFSVPLLIENGLDAMADTVIVVDCEEDTQLTRALKRDGSDETTIRGIMASQASRHDRLAKASHIIDNNGALELLPAQVEQLHQILLKAAEKSPGS
ncbi:dephospho-CoA kinase [Alteromonas sp. RKMC-009]|uniref:dephospho-CoA kinase n=1 Tax=Alteromonas sp. RKMC-009 TaxID=2267264 RepID=UPI000E69923C|nr:dephospho-CoA kinase [Alteromonas sp. RKMC-009]AYA65307.1 dephospho-CoA kinase [Alteromonas sp. RKMC-009]